MSFNMIPTWLQEFERERTMSQEEDRVRGGLLIELCRVANCKKCTVVKGRCHWIKESASKILSIKTGNKTLLELIEGWENGTLLEKDPDQSLPELPYWNTKLPKSAESYAADMLKDNWVKVVGGK